MSDQPSRRKTIVYPQKVEFSDCGPARIVWFLNFFCWIDTASRQSFVQCGVPSWHETEQTLGVIGTPLVDTHARFIKSASYGDLLEIHTHIAGGREKSFVLHDDLRRGDDLAMAYDEVRIFYAHREGAKTSQSGIRAMPIFPSIRSLCR